MSLFDHLVERALELARPVEPVIDPSPLGPPRLAPSLGETPNMAELAVEIPTSQTRAAPITDTRAKPTTPLWSPRETPSLAELAIEAPTDAGIKPTTPAAAPLVERGPARASPIDAPPRTLVVPHPEPAPPRTMSPAGPAGPSLIVERRIEQRIERTRELVHESRVTPVDPSALEISGSERQAEVRPAPAIVNPLPDRRPVEPSVMVIERASPSRERVAGPIVPARREAPAPQAALAPRIAQPPTPAEPTYRIEIGRVIVRAETPTPPSKPAPSASARPLTSLADYLARRDRGER